MTISHIFLPLIDRLPPYLLNEFVIPSPTCPEVKNEGDVPEP
jgi:hypothetical protein